MKKNLLFSAIITIFSVMMIGWIGCSVAKAEDTAKKVDIKPVDSTFFVKDRMKGKVVIVTGGARGIGQASAIRAAREGAEVVIADWLPTEGAATATMITKEGGKAIFVKTDIRKTEECDNLVAETIKKYGKVDCALLNAGVMDGLYSGDKLDLEKQQGLLPASITDATDEYWDNIFAVNAGGTFRTMRAVLRQMVKQGTGGSIVAVGSIAGLTGLAGNPAYVASKHAVNGLVRNAAIDYAPYGIRVNSVNMAATKTPMTDRAFEFVKETQKQGKGSGMGGAKGSSLLMLGDSQHRMATPWEQAAVILFLLSDEASNLTGALYPTDGGWTAY